MSEKSSATSAGIHSQTMFKNTKHDRSRELYAQARELLPGGVNSPVRAFKSVGGDPLFIARGDGAWVVDVDGNRYADYVGGYGPMILGHAHPAVVAALREVAGTGTAFGASTELEIELARRVVELVPSVEMVRMVSSGTEAAMSALRLARAATGRSLCIKFAGGYHGHGDSFLVAAGSGAMTLGTPDSPGVPAEVAAATITLPYNDLEAVEAALKQHDGKVACVMVEPVAGNMGLVLPTREFLPGLRALCTRYGALLVFDEVMTGFRVALGGAQERYHVMPDVTALGKVIGGGLPVGAYGGSKALMRKVAPEGAVYQAGTLSGNPLAMAAGVATLRELTRPGVFGRLEEQTTKLVAGVTEALAGRGVAATLTQAGAMWGLFFHKGPVANLDDVKGCDFGRFKRFFWGMIERGVYLPPSQYEALFMSTAHDDGVVAQGGGGGGGAGRGGGGRGGARGSGVREKQLPLVT